MAAKPIKQAEQISKESTPFIDDFCLSESLKKFALIKKSEELIKTRG